MTVGDSLGHYVITGKIGAGGMGEVYAAQDSTLGRRVAIKVLPPGVASDPDRLRRFEREAQAVAALDHPNIVTIFSIEEDRGVRFITMQLVEGRPLLGAIPPDGLPVGQFFEIAIALADAVATASAQGIAHRDLKPGNIMLNERGQPCVLDFGLAKLVQASAPPEAATALKAEPLTEVGAVMGSAAYMSPEQAEGKTVDHRTDIFSLGIILYEMATGQRPFNGGSKLAILSAIVHDRPVPVGEIRSVLPPGLSRIIALALEKDPARRYQSAADLRIELEALSREVEAGAVQPTMLVGSRAPGSRWRWTLPAAVTVAAVSIAAVVGLSTLTRTDALAFDARGWILITDFENVTGEALFDRSLQTALMVSIDQSSYVNVLPRRRVQGALERMQRGDDERIDESIGSEIAQREEIDLLLVPSISRVGGSYILTGVIQDPVTGEMLRSATVRADSQDEILDALDTLTRRIRADLGEAVESIDRQGRKLVDVTTGSLDALKEYSLGTDNLIHGRVDEADIHYRTALSLDSGFTAAKASLGMLHIDSARKGVSGFDPEMGQALLLEAVREIDGVTDRERFSILAFHAWAVDGDLRAAEEHYRAGIQLYPDLSVYHSNLGWLLQNMGRFDEAVAAYKEAIRVDPYLMLTYDALTYLYSTQLGDMKEAIRIAELQLDYDDNHAGAYGGLGWAKLGTGQYTEARDALARAVELDRHAVAVWYRLVHAHRLLGDFEGAINVLDDLAAVNPNNDGGVHYQKGIIYQLMGDADRAREQLTEFKRFAENRVVEFPENFQNHIALALVLARLGDTEDAQSALRQAQATEPAAHFMFAQVYAVLGMSGEALDLLESAVESGFRDFVWMKVHADLTGLYDEPRFQKLIRDGLGPDSVAAATEGRSP